MPEARNKFTILLKYLKETIKDEVDFCLVIIVKAFFKVMLSSYMSVARHVQITQNKMFPISLQYLKREVNNDVDFFDTIILMGMIKHFQSSPNSKFAMSLEYLKIEVRDEVVFFACR